LPNVGPYIYTTLAFLALLGAPYIYDISSLRVNVAQDRTSGGLLWVRWWTLGFLKGLRIYLLLYLTGCQLLKRGSAFQVQSV